MRPADIAQAVKDQQFIVVSGFMETQDPKIPRMENNQGRLLTLTTHNATTKDVACGAPILVHRGNGVYQMAGIHTGVDTANGVQTWEAFTDEDFEVMASNF
jgi:hypothetical protein